MRILAGACRLQLHPYRITITFDFSYGIAVEALLFDGPDKLVKRLTASLLIYVIPFDDQ